VFDLLSYVFDLLQRYVRRVIIGLTIHVNRVSLDSIRTRKGPSCAYHVRMDR